jgi:hypothetical protein
MLATAACLTGLLLARLAHPGRRRVRAVRPASARRSANGRFRCGVRVRCLAAVGDRLPTGAGDPYCEARSVGRLKEGAKATASRTNTRLRSGLVVAEVALSVIPLAAAGLLLRSFQALQNQNLGFATEHVLVANTEYAVGEDGAEIPARIRFYQDVLGRLRAVPGVTAASGAAYLGMGREPRAPRDYFVEGRPEGRPGERPQAEHYAITGDYFKTLAIPLLVGRDFGETDTEEQPAVAIVNQTLARTAFPGESPIGRRLRVGCAFSVDGDRGRCW